ncbi:MAG: hypothetical protein KJP21_04610 [Bacteroidia bacterium]|nr:hypothetical protein [Bacteroidia bacterium]
MSEEKENIVLTEEFTIQEKWEKNLPVDAYHAAICSGFSVSHWKDQLKVRTSQQLQKIVISKNQFDEIVRNIIKFKKQNALLNDSI